MISDLSGSREIPRPAGPNIDRVIVHGAARFVAQHDLSGENARRPQLRCTPGPLGFFFSSRTIARKRKPARHLTGPFLDDRTNRIPVAARWHVVKDDLCDSLLALLASATRLVVHGLGEAAMLP